MCLSFRSQSFPVATMIKQNLAFLLILAINTSSSCNSPNSARTHEFRSPLSSLFAEDSRRLAEEIRREGGDGRFFIPEDPEHLHRAAELVRANYLTGIERMLLSNISLASLNLADLSTVLAVVRQALVLTDVRLSPSETEIIFRALETLSEGISLNDNVELDRPTATNTISLITSRATSRVLQCYKDSALKYRHIMADWAHLLGWKYQEGISGKTGAFVIIDN